MRILSSTALFFFLSVPALAGSTYDWRTGNQYNTTTYSNYTEVKGYNYNTGTRWKTKIYNDGDMRGTDGNGNRWKYNSTSGYYYNYGTGKTCTGKGAFRTCY